MSKTPGEFESSKPISKEEREARKAFRKVEAETAMSDHAKADKVFSDNRERLKAERLAREAVEPVPPPNKKKHGPKKAAK